MGPLASLSTREEESPTVTAACLFLYLSVSHFPSAVRQLTAALWGKPGGSVRLHRHRRGALSDLLEEDLNPELFNVFLGRQAGRWVHRPHRLPPERVRMVPEM